MHGSYKQQSDIWFHKKFKIRATLRPFSPWEKLKKLSATASQDATAPYS